MNRLTILVVEDEHEVREALVRDLAPFTSHVRVEAAESADDARAALTDVDRDGDVLALVLADHLMPGTSGVDFLVELHDDERTRSARKVLVTGQAGLAETVVAVNEADLDHYLAKPWSPETLADVVRSQLTAFAIDELDDPLPHLAVLDAPRVLQAVRGRLSDR